MNPGRVIAGITVAAAASLALAAGRPAIGAFQSAWPLEILPLASPAAPDSAQPQLTVSSHGALLSWIERSGDRATLKFAGFTGRNWSAPRAVASGTDWFVNWADVPSVVRLDEGTLVAHWLQKSGPGTYAYDVRLAYSRDEGATWSASFTPHSDGTQTEHGFASLFQLPRGGLGLVWLDGRAMKGGHGGHGSGDMSLRYGSFDGEWKQLEETAIDTRVCECCPTAVAVTADGPIVAYRNRGPDEERDIYVSRLDDGRWSEGAAVHADGWKIPACPVNGPALSARGRDVAVAWFTAAGQEGRTFVAFSRDAGRTFGAPVRLDEEGTGGRVGVAWLPDGSAAASYIEFARERAEFRVRRIDRDGSRSAPVPVAGIESGRTSGYPRMAATGDDLLFAWTEREAGSLRVKTAVARISASTTSGGYSPTPR